jgi:hypothetical protein
MTLASQVSERRTGRHGMCSWPHKQRPMVKARPGIFTLIWVSFHPMTLTARRTNLAPQLGSPTREETKTDG